jgi:signal transduction histidine kinase
MSGSGLGLASAKRMIELHGGSMCVESEEGRGSVFTVVLPLDNLPVAQELAPSARA